MVKDAESRKILSRGETRSYRKSFEKVKKEKDIEIATSLLGILAPEVIADKTNLDIRMLKG